MALDDGRHHRDPRRLVGHIERNVGGTAPVLHDRVCDLMTVHVVDVGHDHGRTLLGQETGGGRSDTAARPRDQRYLSIETGVHELSPPF